MKPLVPSTDDQGISLRHAALIAGFGILIMLFAAPFAEVVAYPKLVIPSDIDQTVQNIVSNQGLFLATIFAYLVTFICDVLVAWALYVLFIPVNRSLSLLAAWFRLVYTIVALAGMFRLVTVYRMLSTPDYQGVVGHDTLHAQVQLLLQSFHYEWSMGLVLFGIHLGLLGYLVYRSDYVPRILGILLLIAGPGYFFYYLSPYFYPDANVGFLMVTFMGEPVLMVWLLARGWRILESK